MAKAAIKKTVEQVIMVEGFTTTDINESQKLQKRGIPLVSVSKKIKKDEFGVPHTIITYIFEISEEKAKKFLESTIDDEKAKKEIK